MTHNTNTCAALTVLLTLTLVFAGPAFAQIEPSVVADGLNGPIGVLVEPGAGIFVTEAGFGGTDTVEFVSPMTGQMTGYAYGMSARLASVNDDGVKTLVDFPSLYVNNIESIGASRAAMLNGDFYVTVGAYQEDPDRFPGMGCIHKVTDGEASVVARLQEFEIAENPDTLHIESNPFAIATGPDGTLWATDAAGNDLLKVDPMTGDLEVVAVFGPLPSPIPSAHHGGRMEMDPVPTGLTFDDDGNVYVSLLTGIPFPPGSAKILKVTPDGNVSDYATGLTMLTDVEMAPDGNLYAVSFGEFSEQGPMPEKGAIYRIKEGEGSETVASGLSFATSIDFNEDGDAFVTVLGNVAEHHSGQLLRFDGLASGGK